MTKVRSEYVKKLINESNSLEDKLKEVAESTINNILEEKTNKNLRQILSEGKDSFSEEEVDDDVELGADDEGDEEDTENGGEWDDLDQYKDEDGEYDLRSLDKDELVKVLKAMNPEDSVRIVKNDDDSMTMEDADGEEYELELDDFGGEDDFDDEDDFGCGPDGCDMDGGMAIEIDFDGDDFDGIDEFGDDDVDMEIDTDDDDIDDEIDIEDEDGDTEIEIETDDEGDEDIDIDDEDDDAEIEVELDEQKNFGNSSPQEWRDDYQHQTAMTTPPNKETGKHVRSWDAGVPKGTEKPWAGPKRKVSYTQDVDESIENECGFEEGCCGFGGCGGGRKLKEAGMGVAHGSVAHGCSKSHENTNLNGIDFREGSKGGQAMKNPSWKNPTDISNESIRRKANEIFNENKQMKALMPKLKRQIQEAIVVNQSLANVIKLLNENATTTDEKKAILKRFNECTTIDDSNRLYKVISEELKRSGKTYQNLNEAFNSQLAESRSRAVETPMYQSQDLSNTLDFMARLDAVK